MKRGKTVIEGGDGAATGSGKKCKRAGTQGGKGHKEAEEEEEEEEEGVEEEEDE